MLDSSSMPRYDTYMLRHQHKDCKSFRIVKRGSFSEGSTLLITIFLWMGDLSAASARVRLHLVTSDNSMLIRFYRNGEMMEANIFWWLSSVK